MGVVESSAALSARSSASLAVSHRNRGGCLLLELSGEADITTRALLSEELAYAVTMNRDNLVVDVTGLRFCDVHSAHQILTACRPAQVTLIGATGPVRRVFDLLNTWQARAGAPTPDVTGPSERPLQSGGRTSIAAALAKP